MKKSKKTISKIGKYFRELSTITVGVAITLAISAWINNVNTRKDIKLYFGAIKTELEENIKYIEERKLRIQICVNYSNYLASTDKNSLSFDSVRFYQNRTVFDVQSYHFKTNAFDMFQASGMMRLVDNKELMLTLWNTYNQLDMIEFHLKAMMQFKSDEMIFELRNPSNIAMYTFYAKSTIPQMMLDLLNEALNVSNETLSSLK